ncbi:hypothetical protein [Ramlibacter sp.]|uniref:hypothetical protein n=1 Tax=Ramlibacter sp. TaxID=1917967 RepID=UPI003D0E38F3
MAKMVDTFFFWARKTTGSVTDFLASNLERDDAPGDASPSTGLIFKLRHWPELQPSQRTAKVLRLLSVMSHRPINRHWMLANSRLSARQVDELLALLVAQEAVEVVDSGKFRASQL